MRNTNAYTPWLRRHVPSVASDLASSGIRPFAESDLVASRELGAQRDPEANLRLQTALYNGVTESECLLTLGTVQALYLACAALINPGDHVIVERPAYEPLWRLPQAFGARLSFLEREVAHGYAVGLDELRTLFCPHTRLVILSNLHNPSGMRIADRELRQIASELSGRGIYLLVDEVYAPFDGFLDENGIFGHSARRLGDNVLAAGSLTKCFGAGVERQGWLLGPPQVLALAREALLGVCNGLPRSHAVRGLQLLASLPNLSRRARGELVEKRAVVDAWLLSHPTLRPSRPSEGLFSFVEAAALETNLTARIEWGAREHGVLVAPGEFFGRPQAFRLAWALEHSKLAEALSRLDRVLNGTCPFEQSSLI